MVGIMDTPNVVVTLVHGTWGRFRLPFSGPLWFETGSPFVQRLTEELQAVGLNSAISQFLWSGANSLLARSDAAIDLAGLLSKQERKHAGALQVIVGHSHGGSVCLLSLRQLWPDSNPAVVTLATPFMEVVRSEPVGDGAKIKRFIVTALPSIGLLTALSMLYQLLDIREYNDILYYLMNLVTAVRLLPDLYGIGKVDPGKVPDWISPEPHRPEFYQALTIGGATMDPPRNTLVIRGIDDEAGMVLAAGSIANRLASLALSYTISLTYLGMYLCLLALAVVWVDEHYLAPLLKINPTISAIIADPHFAYSVFFSITAFFLFPIFSGVFKSVYGRELAIGGIFCDIKSASAPDAVTGVTTTTFSPTARKGMRHGIYNHERTPRAIAQFVKSLTEQSVR
jgi:hypothetical protein